MFVPFHEIEKMTDLFTLGAYFLFMVYGASTLFKHSRHHLHRVTAWVLVWWAFLVFDGYIGYLFPYGSEISRDYDRFAGVLDMTVVVGVVMIGYALTYTRKVTFGLLTLHSIPYIVFLCAVIFARSDQWAMLAFIWTIAYGFAYLIFFLVQIRAYNARIHAVYSDDNARDLSWLTTLMWVFAGMLVVWAIPTYLHIVGTYIIFYVSSIALWWVALNRIIKQKPVNIRYYAGNESDESGSADDTAFAENMPESAGLEAAAGETGNEEGAAVLDRRYSFAPRLQRLFTEEEAYLQPDLNINELARLLGTNRAYLSAYLNNVLNVSFFDFVNSWRIKKAVYLLSNSLETIDVVADNCGFNNTYTFRRVFVKVFSCTPTEWRHLSPEEREEKMKLLG